MHVTHCALHLLGFLAKDEEHCIDHIGFAASIGTNNRGEALQHLGSVRPSRSRRHYEEHVELKPAAQLLESVC